MAIKTMILNETDSFQTVKIYESMKKTFKIQRFNIKNMLHLNHCFIISHFKNLVLRYLSILRYFGQCEDIFCPFGILVG